MKSKKAYILTLITLSLFWGCQKQTNIQGKWIAYEVLEDKTPLEINPKDIRFEFNPNHTFVYKNRIGKGEKGTYQAKGNILITTTGDGDKKKKVRFQMPSQDSLSFQMNFEGKERVINMIRA